MNTFDADDEKNKETTQEGYGSEEFEDDNSHGGSHGGTSPIHNSKTTGMCIGKCAVVTWTASKRKVSTYIHICNLCMHIYGLMYITYMYTNA